MPTIKILTEAELRACVSLDLAAVDCVEQAFSTLAQGNVVMPPIMSMAMHEQNGEICVKAAYMPGLDSFAVKMSPGFFDNPKLGLPSTSGLMVVFSARTGVLEALLLDNGYLTDVRTAAAGAVAARHLAREDAATACVIGTGVHARLQLAALMLVRPITQATIWGRNPDKATPLAAELAEELGIEVTASTDAASAVQSADVVITTTASAEPVIQADWLRPGQHITAMGSDQDYKCELDPACLTQADLYVPDSQAQTEERGELRPALAAGVIPSGQRFAELGDITSGKAPGRQTAEQVTIADLTGTGVQDTAIASFALQQALKNVAGHMFDA